MSFSIDYLPAENLICITNVGALSLSDYERGAEGVLALMKKQAVWRCLIDNRELDNRASIADIYKLPTYYATLGMPRTIRAAVLIGEEAPKKENFEFFETVCHNNGYSFRLFTNRDEALAWLRA